MALAYIGHLRRFNRNVWLALLAWAIGLGGFFGIVGVLFNLYLLRLGYGTEWIGLVSAAGGLAFAAGSVLAGALGRRYSLRRMMMAGMSFNFLGSTLAAQAELAPENWRPLWIMLMMVGSYAGLGLFIASVAPFLMHVSDPDARDHVFSVMGAGSPLAAFLASLLAGALPAHVASALRLTLNDPAPFRWVLTGGALLQVVPVLALWLAREEQHQVRNGVEGRSPFPLAAIAAVTVITLLRWAGIGPMQSFLNVYMDRSLGVSTALIGSQAALAQLASIPAALTAAVLAARWGRFTVVSAGVLVAAICTLPVALVSHWAAAAFSNAAVMSLFALTSPVYAVYQQELVPREWQPAMSAASGMASGLGAAALATAGGFLIHGLGYETLFLVSAALTLACALVFWAYFRVPRGELARRAVDG